MRGCLLQAELRGGRGPAGDGREHEPRAAVRARVAGRRLLRRQERRVRRRGGPGRRHGAHHPRPHLRDRIGRGGHGDNARVVTGDAREDTCRRGVGGRGTTGRAIQAMRQAGKLAGARRGAGQPEAAGERQRSFRPQKATPAWTTESGRRSPPDPTGGTAGGRMDYGYTAGWLDI